MEDQMPSSSQEVFVRVLKHRSAVMAVIVALVRDFAAADDLFQDTVLEIVRSYERFEEDRDFVRWAKGIARNVVMRYWSSTGRFPVSMDNETLELVGDIMLPENDPDLWEKERVGLRQCLKKLSESKTNLFLQRYGNNLRGEALAREVGMNLKSLRTTLARIRHFLRNCITLQIKNLDFRGEAS